VNALKAPAALDRLQLAARFTGSSTAAPFIPERRLTASFDPREPFGFAQSHPTATSSSPADCVARRIAPALLIPCALLSRHKRLDSARHRSRGAGRSLRAAPRGRAGLRVVAPMRPAQCWRCPWWT